MGSLRAVARFLVVGYSSPVGRKGYSSGQQEPITTNGRCAAAFWDGGRLVLLCCNFNTYSHVKREGMGSLTAGVHFAPFFYFFISNASLGCDTESGWHKMRRSK
jgi:hypothetical protein